MSSVPAKSGSASTRILALDLTKGALVVFMVAYHSFNYSTGVSSVCLLRLSPAVIHPDHGISSLPGSISPDTRRVTAGS
jgi:hypothetical protein